MKKVILFSLFAVIGLMSMTNAYKPVIFKLDASKSTFKWTGKKVTGSHWGYVKFSDGTLQVEKGKLMGGSFNVDMTTMDCQDTQGEWGAKLVGHLKGDDFFSVEKFPKSTLVIKSVTSTGATQYNIVADLTIKGITKEISFPATVAITGNTVSAQANFNINRTNYDVKYGSGSFFSNLGDKAIDDNFNVEVNLVATTDAAPTAVKKAKKAKKATATSK